ncbi:MAG: DNA polymerase III subunit alpha [Elusimicrobia bacterium RBG_16_66_12]|nr:MAG: DNA polymerase III subunit alpha [Elusimicrobia bacterium RBG_16_66_12]
MDGVIRLSDKDGKPSQVLKDLAASGAKGFAITDHGNMYGAVEFYSNAKAVGLKAIIGVETYISKGARFDRGHSQKENCHLTLLAKNYEGYQNLMELCSIAFKEGYYYDPRIDKELLAKHAKGLVVLSGCLKGELSQSILSGDLSQAEKLVAWYRDNLEPESFYLEIMDHGLEKQRQLTQALLELNRRTRVPLVATNDSHYWRRDDNDAHDARVCIATGRKLADTERLKFETHEFYVKSPEAMHKLFGFAPESLSSTLKIAEMCNLKIPMDQMLLPEFKVPEGFSQDSYLEHLCLEGLQARFPGGIKPRYKERLDYELGVIKRMGFSGYFLIVWDFIKHARSIGVPVGPGRGSGAGAIVAYALRITNADPIEYKLLFERFLNPDRRSMPDLDIDFADTGRDKVIQYVRQKYGEECVAQIITFGSLGAKLVIRDVGRVLDMPLTQVNEIAKKIPVGPNIHLHEAMQQPELAEMAKDPQVKRLLELSLKLEGLKRHTGVHAAGTLITKEPVVKYTPLAKGAKSGVITTQYDGDVCPKLGLLKVDFLGLRTLSIIDDAVKFVRARHDPKFDIDQVPMDDAKTYEMLRTAKSLAVFQLDSQGIRDLLFRIKPTVFDDIVSLIALFRPGPMQSGMLDMFVDRKHGREEVKYDHALLEPILKDTYGCMVFQEQVMEISKKLAGFTPGEADGLRKAMGKKIAEDLEKMRDKFVKGCGTNKISPKLANKIYDQMVKFGGYGFNKSHSVAYGLVAYQTAYLKTNFPIEFMTAVLTSEIGHSAIGAEDKENKLVTYLEEARRMGVKVLPPDVNRSETRFSIEDGRIRFGLLAVKNVGEGPSDSIAAAASEKPFASLDDLCSRVDLHAVNKKTLESLAKAGALDGLRPGDAPHAARARLLLAIDEAVGRQQRVKADLDKGQGLLFGAAPPPPAAAGGADAAVKPLSEHDTLAFEREVLGFYFSGHPLLAVKMQLKAAATHEAAQLAPSITTPVRLAGMISKTRKMVSKKTGEPWLIATLEDLTGEVTLLCFPKVYASGLAHVAKIGAMVTASGRLSFKDEEAGSGAPELIVDEMSPLDMAVSRYAKRLRLKCDATLGTEKLESLRDLLEAHRGPCPVALEQETSEGLALLEVDQRVTLDQPLLEAVEALLGERSWRIDSGNPPR